MKTKIWTILLVIGLVFFLNESVDAQNWGSVVNKGVNTVKNNKNKNKNKNKDKDKENNQDVKEDVNEEVNGEVNEDNENNTQNIDNNSSQKLKFNADEVIVSYESFFKNLKLDTKTGELKLKQVSIKNLPEATYGFGDNKHTINAVLMQNNKQIAVFPFADGNEVGGWTSIEQRNQKWEKASYTFSEAGDYSFEFQIDEQTADKIDFNVTQSMDANGYSSWILGGDFEKLGYVTPNSYKELRDENDYSKYTMIPNETSEFVFYYFGPMDYFAGSKEHSNISLRLMKANPNGDDIYMGGYLDQHLFIDYNTKQAKIFFENTNGEKVTYGEVVAADGKYYIDLFFDDEIFRYDFEVNNKQLVSEFGTHGEKSNTWIKRKYVAIPKYDGFRPVEGLSSVKDNMRVLIKTKDGNSSQGYSVGKTATFSDGQVISMSYYPSEETKKKYEYKLTEFVITMMEGNKILAQNIRFSVYQSNGDFATITNKPEILHSDQFAHEFMEAMAKLPAGNHNLRFIYEVASENNNDIVGARTVTFKSDGKNAKFAEWAEETKKQNEMTPAEKANLWFLNSPSDEWVYFVNNCGRVLWMREDQYKEYYLYPGDKAKFNRSGAWEQWNFGTLQWNDIDDFTVEKTIWVLDANEIAMLQLKQMPQEAITKLKEIQDVEFKTQDAYIAKVKALIGTETYEKHKNLLLQSASIDFVKICK